VLCRTHRGKCTRKRDRFNSVDEVVAEAAAYNEAEDYGLLSKIGEVT
jgi:hypothetical protein